MGTATRIADIAADLRDHAADAVVTLLGQPTSRTTHELRFGTHRKLAVVLTGPKAGLWHDHSSGESGDILTLVQRELGRENGLDWARSWLGVGDGDVPPPAAAGKRRRLRSTGPPPTPTRRPENLSGCASC